MAEESLRIKIGADVADFEKAIDKVEKDMKGIQPVVTTTGKSFTDLGKAVTKTATDVQKLPDAAGKAGNVLTNLSRVASDAPFGFIAIQNNLDPLIDSFGRLQRESGGTGTAIKALAGSLAGPAGLALGFSVVSSLVTSAIQEYGSLGAALTALTGQNAEFVKQQKNINELRADAAKQAGEEIAKLDILLAVTNDVTLSTTKRKDAANELIKQYGTYLPNVTQEAILNNQAADAINRAKDAILNKALAAASERKLAEIGDRLLANQLKQLDVVRNYGNAQAELNKARQQFAKDDLSNAQGINFRVQQYVTLLEAAKGELKATATEAASLNQEYETLKRLAAGFAVEVRKAAPDVGGGATGGGGVKPKITPVQVPVIFPKATITQGILQADAEIQKNFRLQEGINIPVNIQVPRTAIESLRAFGEQARQALDLQRFRENVQLITNVFTQVFSPAIDQFFDNLGQGKNILKTLGESVKQFVIGAIKQFVKLAAVAGLISLVTGVPFSASFKAVAGGGGAGGFFGGGFSGAAPLGGLTGGGIGVNVGGQFNIRGTDLVAVVNQGTQRIGRVG
jgi:hypothetical protein